MNLKYILIILVVVGLGWFIFSKNTATAPVLPVPAPTPAPIVGENPEGEADPNVMKLDMKPWVWISALYNDGTNITPKIPGKFTLTFKKDGTFFASTDCNGISGNYKVTGKQITFSNMISTLMFCEGSQEGEIRKILENTSSYFSTSRGELILELKFDSGTATFR